VSEDLKDDKETKSVKQSIEQSIRTCLKNSFIGCEKLEYECAKQKIEQAIEDMLEKATSEDGVFLEHSTIIQYPYPVKYISYNFCLSEEECKEEDHTGMVYNPYSDKWSYL
jgi:uncharacterized membrane protein YgaE (UPF0421/DUF939 family)